MLEKADTQSRHEPKRFRIFAGPNGSGKSSIIRQIQQTKILGRPIDFGIYVNADLIANELLGSLFNFGNYGLSASIESIIQFGLESGLLDAAQTPNFQKIIRLQGQWLVLLDHAEKDLLAQILALYIVNQRLKSGQKVSFETVFSHPSKIDLIRYANSLGYKTYLYFVSTQDPEINCYRVKIRVQRGGHDVPESKIRERYYRTLSNLKRAADEAYQAYFFDNSGEEGQHLLFAHFKAASGQKKWDPISESQIPAWFKHYYLRFDPSAQNALSRR